MASFLCDLGYDPTRQIFFRDAPQNVTTTYPGTSTPIPTNAFDRLEFVQSTASTTWIWNHNLGYRPVPQIMNLGGQQISAQVEHISVNQIKVTLNPAQVGRIVV
jgi:hypothetical protein